MTNAEQIEKLAAVLWKRTRQDWVINIDWIITEPVCPVAWVAPESCPYDRRFQAIGDTLDEAIAGTVANALRFWDNLSLSNNTNKGGE